MKNFVIFGVTHLLRLQKYAFLRKTRKLKTYQHQFLMSLLKTHAETEFGRKHGFVDIQSIADYQRQVPIHTYAQVEADILRMAEGEENILVRDRPIYFNITSGSTGKRKMIPVTPTSRKQVKKASEAAMGFVADASLRCNRPLGTLLFPASVNSVGKTKSGVDFAPVSTSDLKLSSMVSRSVMASPALAHQISDLKSRNYVCLLFALTDPNLRIIAETFPVTALRLCQYLATYSAQLIENLRTGTLADWLKLTPEERVSLKSQLKPNPTRAQSLDAIFQAQGRLTPQTAWPNLSFVTTARGGTSDFYFKRFPEYFGDLPVFGGVYSSAEATYGIHRDFNTDGVLLALETGFYEFIPEDQWDSETPQTLLPWQVEPGKKYRIVVTNYNGFYRYDVGDVVEIESFHHQTPIFIFRNRYKGFITSVGEKTTEYHVVQVINALQEQYHLTLENFCIVLSDEIPPRYLVYVELAEGEQLHNPEAFIADFDRILGEVHVFYELKRRDQVPPPILKILKSGSFQNLQSTLVQQGAAISQIKLPKISDNRDLLSDATVLQEWIYQNSA